MDTWIKNMVKARSSRRVMAWGLTCACVALLGFAQTRYIKNFLFGPFAMGQSELDQIQDASQAPRYFARVTGSKVIDTGIQQISVRKRRGVETGRSVSAAYYALVVGDRLLVSKSSSGALPTQEGELAPIPLDVSQQLFDTPDMQAIRSRFYPFYLNGESFRFPGYLAIAGLLVLALLVVFQALPAWRHLQEPDSHPLMKRVAEWGDPIGNAVAAERAARAPRYKASGWLVSDQFLLRSTFFTFDLLRMSDLLWAYKKVTKHSVNFIPTGKTYEAVLACYGGTATLQGNEKTTDEILGFAARRTPWAVFGYTKEFEDLFNKSTPEFCAGIEQRKREFAQQQRSAPSQPPPRTPAR